MAKKIDLTPPTKDPIKMEEYFWAAQDFVAKSVIRYLLENEEGYFNKMSKTFSTSDIASRNTLFGRLLRMERAGIIQADLVRISYGEERIQKWVKEYKISKKAKEWAEDIRSTIII